MTVWHRTWPWLLGVALGFVLFAGLTNLRLVLLAMLVCIPFAIVKIARLLTRAITYALDHFVWGWFRTDHNDRALKRWQREAIREATQARRARMRETTTWENF